MTAADIRLKAMLLLLLVLSLCFQCCKFCCCSHCVLFSHTRTSFPLLYQCEIILFHNLMPTRLNGPYVSSLWAKPDPNRYPCETCITTCNASKVVNLRSKFVFMLGGIKPLIHNQEPVCISYQINLIL